MGGYFRTYVFTERGREDRDKEQKQRENRNVRNERWSAERFWKMAWRQQRECADRMIEWRKLTLSVGPEFPCARPRLLLEVDKIFMKHDRTLMDFTMDHWDRWGKWGIGICTGPNNVIWCFLSLNLWQKIVFKKWQWESRGSTERINYSLVDHFLIEILHLSCCENVKIVQNRVFNAALVTLDIKSSTYSGGGACYWC